MEEYAFLNQVAHILQYIINRPGHGGYAQCDSSYYPWPEHRCINLSIWGLTKEELIDFAEETMKLAGYRIRKEALTPHVLRRELKTYIDAQKK